MGKDHSNGENMIPQERGFNGGFEGFPHASILKPPSLINSPFNYLSL